MDSIVLTETTAAIDIVITTVGAAYSAATADTITGFDVALASAKGDNIDIDLSDVEAITGITDLALAGNGAASAAATDTGVTANVTAAYDMGGAATAIWLNVSGTYAASTNLETALEIGGTRALTTNGIFAAADAFLVTYSDGTDAYIASVHSAAGAADNATFAANDLTVTNLIKLAGITDVTKITADAIDIIA